MLTSIHVTTAVKPMVVKDVPHATTWNLCVLNSSQMRTSQLRTIHVCTLNVYVMVTCTFKSILVSSHARVPISASVRQMLLGIRALLEFYVPALFIIGRNVRNLAWEGGIGGRYTGTLAREVLEQCLALHMNVLSDWDCKAEYTRTLSVALLSWQPYYSGLPGCCFVEEAGEALLSRMVGRQRRNRHVATVEGVLQLFVTVPPPRPTANATRGTIRRELVQLVRNRLYRIITNTDFQPFARVTGARAAHWEAVLPADLHMPGMPRMESQNVSAVLRRSLRVLSTGTPCRGPMKEFADANFPAMDADAVRVRRALADQHLDAWFPRRRRVSRGEIPQDVASPPESSQQLVDESARPPTPTSSEDHHRYSPPRDSQGGSLYDPSVDSADSDAFSEGCESVDSDDSLGSTGGLVHGSRANWGTLSEDDFRDWLTELGVSRCSCICICRDTLVFSAVSSEIKPKGTL